MGLIDIYVRTVDGRIIVLKDVKTSITNTVELLKPLVNEHFDPPLIIANMRFLYRGTNVDDVKLKLADLFGANKMLFLDLVVVEPNVYRDTELDIYLVKNTVAYPGELYPTGHEDSPFLRVGAIEYKQNNPSTFSMSAFGQHMKRIESEIDNSIREAKGMKVPNKKVSVQLSEIQRSKEVKGGRSNKTKRRRGSRKSRKQKQ